MNGRILDASTDVPLPGASVVLLDKEGKTIAGTAADNNGNFKLENSGLSNLYNKIQVSYIGYEPTTMSVSAAGGNMYLAKKGDTLGAVIVIGKRAAKKDNVAQAITIASVLLIFKTIFKF